jgi:formyl-CoA transferase
MMLADLGATVVKVERPHSGDDTRGWGPPWTPGGSSYFDGVNRSKRSLTLALDDETDLRRAQELARRADVVIHNFRSGVMEKYGLDYASVFAGNADVVYCSITGFGSGAGARIPGYDFVVQAVGGLMHVTGDPQGEPMKVGVALVDVLTGKDAVIGILAALRSRERDQRGQHIEVSLLTSLLAGMVNQASGFLATGVSPERLGNLHPSIAPYETLQCSDGLLAVACGNDRQFHRLAEVLDLPDLSTDPRFALNSDRVTNRKSLREALESRLVADTASEWAGRLVASGVPAGVVGTLGTAFELATDLGLEPLWSMPEAHIDQVSHPIKYSHSGIRPPLAPPVLGQDATELCRWLDEPRAVV